MRDSLDAPLEIWEGLVLKAAKLIGVFLLLGAGSVTPAVAAKRVALVIGNSAYEHSTPLNNPKNDATAMAETLSRLGFEVTTGINLTDRTFGRTIAKFRKALPGAEVALFFYAGHGLQVHGRNFLIPVDAKIEDEDSLDFEAVRLRTVLTLMEREPRTNLVFLDACRDNPMARNLARNLGTRSTVVGRGFAREESGIGTMIAFATQPGNVALDGDVKHSPFTKALLKYIETPGQDIANLMRRVRLDVITETSSRQVPWNHSSLTAPFVFKEKPSEDPVTRAESTLWEAVQTSDNAKAYTKYLEQHPKGRFVSLARIKLEELKFREDRESERARREKEREELARVKSELAKEEERLAKAQAARKRQEEEERKRAAEERARLETERKTLAAAAKSEPVQVAKLSPSAQVAPEPQTGALLDPKEITLALQTELKRVGCDPGRPDGVWGRKGKAALTSFNSYAKLNLPTIAPSQAALTAVRSKSTRVCPAVPRRANTQPTSSASKKGAAKAAIDARQAATRGKCQNGNLAACDRGCRLGSERACYAAKRMRQKWR